jgi:heme exporter protein A
VAAIELAGLARHYGERAALDDVSLSLDACRTLAVLGPNGAGKSTLLRVLGTLLRPHRGTARVLGRALPDEGHLLRGQLGFVGHEALLYRELSGRENLLFYARLYGAGAARVDELIEAVGMGARAEDPVRTLSRGMVQRLAICRAVLHRPRLLDPAALELVAPLIGRQTGCTRVLTSHDPAGALEEADLVLALRDGRVALLDEPSAVDDAKLRELYQ